MQKRPFEPVLFQSKAIQTRAAHEWLKRQSKNNGFDHPNKKVTNTVEENLLSDGVSRRSLTYPNTTL